MSDFQRFTQSVVDGLKRKDAGVISLIDDGSLDVIFSSFEFDFTRMKTAVKDAMLKHPRRRTPQQHLFLVLVQNQVRGELNSPRNIIDDARIEFEHWREHTYDPDNFIKDLDALYFFRNKSGIKDIDMTPDDADRDLECSLCENVFDQELHQAQRAPCGHITCRECFSKWLAGCTGTYTCMFCRGCLVCGTNQCPHHKIQRDATAPRSLSWVLDRYFPHKESLEFHGIDHERYLLLREATRKDRVAYALIEEVLRVNEYSPLDPVHVRLETDAQHIALRIRDAALKSMAET